LQTIVFAKCLRLYTILLAGLGVSLTSITGLLIIKSHPKVASFINKKLRTLTAISAGVFLVTSFVLINETLEILSLTRYWPLLLG